jgi:hypothetical protein
MALVSFVSEPQAFTPSDNPITWTLSYPMSGAYKLFFEIVVLVDGDSVATLRVDQERSDGTDYFAHIDVSNIVKTYVNKSLVGQSTIVSDANNYKSVQLLAAVYYATTENGIVSADISTLNASTTIYAFKSCLSKKEFVNWDYTDYQIGGSTKKFLTDNTNNVELREGDSTYLTIIEGNYTNFSLAYTITFNLYNNSNTLIATNSINISVGTDEIKQFNINTSLLISEGLFTQGNIDNSDYINVLLKAASAGITETKRININKEGCYKGKNVIWLNKFGAYDSFLFTYNTILKSDVQSKSYGKQFGAWNGETYEYTTKDTGSLTYLKTITDKVQIVSDWLTQSEQNWLVSIYDSPLVYMNEDTTYENIEIENSSYGLKQMEHEELFNEILECKFTNTRNSVVI